MNKNSNSSVPSRIKLSLRRVSLRTLSDSELTGVAGGSVSIDTEGDPTGCRGGGGPGSRGGLPVFEMP
jgi:hypothetical protein